MADNIVKLKVDSSEYEGKIKRAAQGIQALGQNLRSAGKTFADADKEAVVFARELGKMQTVSTSARGKVNELSAAFVNLKSDYMQMSEAEKRSPIGQAMAKSLDELKNRTISAKNELESLKKELDDIKNPEVGSIAGNEGGGFKDMLSVFGGNMLTKAAEFAANIGSEVVTVLNESSNLAREAEGVRIAFERLGRGDLLDGLRDATHGTVSDFELMKAAVKFDDFKLPLDELGTMLSFAQKKAKDTGQSVDYMVDSIVTGLGRKSLMILDNLGLSANEVKNKMKETGDMTKAVGEIIREQMAKAGEYVDTAADKSSRANAELQNQMIELGRLMQETFGYTGWSDFAAGIKTEVVGALNFTIETILRAKQTWNDFLQFMGIQDKPQKPKPTPPAPNGTYFETTDADGNLINAGRWMNGKQVVNTMGVTVTGNAPDPNKKKTTPTHRTTTKPQPTYMDGSITAQTKLVQELTKQWNDASEEMKNGYLYQLVEAEQKLKEMKESDAFNKKGIELLYSMKNGEGALPAGIADSLMPDLKAIEKEFEQNPIKLKVEIDTEKMKSIQKMAKLQETLGNVADAANSIGQAFNAIEDPAAKVAGTVMQAIANVALGYASAVKYAGEVGGPWGWIAFAATGLATMMSSISAIHSATGYAQGGVVKGNSYSGDNMMFGGDGLYGLNAGEVVLTKAMQGNLASQLQESGGGGIGGGVQVARISGEQIYVALNRYLKRSGQGELATWG